MLFGCRLFVLMVGCKEVGEVNVEGLREVKGNTMVQWTLRGFCVYTLGGSLAEDECKWGCCGW